MNTKEIKQVRGQLREITKDILPELLNDALYQRLAKEMREKLGEMAENIRLTLANIDERSKDIQGYLVRQSTIAPTLAPTSEAKNDKA